jgi:hypothetical protein
MKSTISNTLSLSQNTIARTELEDEEEEADDEELDADSGLAPKTENCIYDERKK